jgi:hypothetical protein
MYTSHIRPVSSEWISITESAGRVVAMGLVWVAVVGALVLAGISVAVGLLEGRALEDAWRRVATQRRIIGERSRELDEREHMLDVWERFMRRLDEQADERDPDDEPG